MLDKIRMMIYVEDVERCVQFWQDYLDAQVASVKTMPDQSKNVVLTIAEQVELAFFDKTFIAKYSPEVQTNLPSLMLFSDRFDDLHHQIPGAGQVSDVHGQLTFNFADPEGNYFVIAKS